MGKFKELEIEKVGKAEEEIKNIFLSLSSATPHERRTLIASALQIARENNVIPHWLALEILYLPGIGTLIDKEIDSKSIRRHLETDKKHRKIYLISIAYDNVRQIITRDDGDLKEDLIAKFLNEEFAIPTIGDSVRTTLSNFRKKIRSYGIHLSIQDLDFIDHMEAKLLESYSKNQKND